MSGLRAQHSFLSLSLSSTQDLVQTWCSVNVKPNWTERGDREGEGQGGKGSLGLAERECLTYVGEVLGILTEELGKNGLPLEPFFILKDVAIHETIHHGGVGVDVNIKLQACFLLRERITNEKSGVTKLTLKGPDTALLPPPHTDTSFWVGPVCQLI